MLVQGEPPADRFFFFGVTWGFSMAENQGLVGFLIVTPLKIPL